MAQQGTQINTTTELTDLIKIGEFFLQPENLHKKYDNFWDYDKIYFLLRSWAREINTNLDENPPLSEIIKVLNDPSNTQAILESNSINPVQLQYLEKEAGKAKELNNEAIIIAQRKKRAFMKFLLAQAKIKNNYLDFLNSSLQKLAKSPIEPDQAHQITQAISDNLEVDHSYLIEAIKAETSSDPKIEQNLTDRQRIIWETAIDKAVIKLGKDRFLLSQKQIDFLKSLTPVSVFEGITDSLKTEAPTSVQETGTLYEAPKSNRKVTAIIEEVIGPTSSEVEKTVRKIAPLVYANIQSDPTISKSLSEKEIRDLRVKIQNEAVLSLAQAAPRLIEDITLTPAETAKVLAAFSLTDDQIRQLAQTPLFSAGQLEKAVILQPQNISPIETAQDLPMVKPPLLKSSPYSLRNKSGNTLGRELRNVLLTNGVNKESVPVMEREIGRLRAIGIISSGLTPQVLEKALQIKIKAGLLPNNPVVKELKHLIEITNRYLNEENPLLLRSISKKIKPGIYPILRSENGSLIPVGSFADKILRGQKIKFLQSNLAVFVNPIAFLRTKTADFAKNIFFKTSLGKTFLGAINRQSLNFLQKLWGAGFKGTVSKGVSALLAKVGITLASNIAAPITAAIVFLVPKLLGLVKKIGAFFLSGFGIANFLLSALGQGNSEEDSKMVKWVIIGTIVAVFFFSTFQSSYTLGGAFVSSGRGGMEDEIGPGVNPIGSTIDCTRQDMHLGEQVICQLSKRDDPCNQTRISTLTWDKVLSCFAKNETNFQNKETIKSIFSNSIIANGNLQCVGFITAIQLALSKGLDKMGDACSYAHGNPPSGYVYIRASQIGEIQKGDIAVWDDPLCGAENHWGHVGIVVNRDGETKIDIAQANGKNGEIDIKGYPLDNPTLYLRYSH